jgi:hypothetical protein
MKTWFGIFVATVGALCCLTQAGTGTAPEDTHQRAKPLSKGGGAVFDHLTNAADQGDSGTHYYVSRNSAEALRSIRKAADQGDARAQPKCLACE